MNESRQERWTNDATCAVASWLDRHEGRSEYWHQQAQKCREDAPRDAAVLRGLTPEEEAAKYLLSEQLREEITEGATRAVQTPDSDHLEAALEEVNWDEIADHYLEKIGAALSPFGPVIFRYTRAQAIDDGVLIDVSATAREAGIRLHTCVTAAVWQEYVRVPEGVTGQDERGRLWDIVWMLRCAIVRERHEATSQINYQLLVRNDNRQPDLVTLKALCGPGDQSEPVMTIMLPHED